MIKLKIDVTKIRKDRLYKGSKGTYLNAIMIETPNSDYGDYMICEDVSKEERMQGKKGNILGNAQILDRSGGNTKQASKSPATSPQDPTDVPF